VSDGFEVGNNDDVEIDLSLGEELVPIQDFEPAPEGMYKLMLIDKPTVQLTQAGENMVVCKLTILGPGSAGKKVRESFVIPGNGRKEEKTKDGKNKWEVMMGMVRQRLEAITGQPWRENDMKLKPSTLAGNTVIAKLKIVEREYTDKDGAVKNGKFNEVDGNLRVDDGSLDAKIEDYDLRAMAGQPDEAPDTSSSTAGGFNL
jgi:hypothetical protein